jgi:PAS domain S-box-containing protein
MGNKVNNTKKSKCSTKSKQNYSPVRSEFEQLVDASKDAIRIINKDFTIRQINRAFADMTGVNQNDVIGGKCWEIFPSSLCHTPECRAYRIINGEQTIEVEIERKKKDGTTISCVVTTFSLADEVGNTIGVVEQFRDITQRHHMEDQIRESEERYRSLIELGAESGEAIVMLQDQGSSEGIQVFINDHWPRISGYAKEELLGTSFFDLIILDDRQSSIDRHRMKMSKNTVPGTFEMNIIRKDKTIIPIEVTGAFTSYQGKVANVLYIRDISIKKKIQNELENYRLQLEKLVSERTQALEQELKNHKQTEEALKISEDRYRSLFENVPVAIFECDYSALKKYIDSLMSKNTDDYFNNNPDAYKDCTELFKIIDMNKALVDLYEAENKENVYQFFKEASTLKVNYYKAFRKSLTYVTKGKTQFSYKEYVPTLKGHWQHHIVKFHLAPGYENTLSRVFISVFDITYLKYMENKLKKYYAAEKILREKLEQEIEQRLEFTRSLVHELKTPLTAMISSSELLSEELDNISPTGRLASNIRHSAHSLNKRIDEMLDITRGEIGVLKIIPEPIDPMALLLEISEEMASIIKQNKQTLGLNIPGILPVIMADREKLREIILNLLSNAIKFNRDEGAIYITTRETKNLLYFEVSDEGFGISQEDCKRLFKPYQRLRPDTKNFGGLGLGLALSKTLVELHKGKIGIRRKKGSGSTFYFSIPKCKNS